MASDNRDWYRDWWRKKTGYIERASFRLGQADHQRAKIQRKQEAHSSAWRRNLFIAVAAVIALILLATFR